MRSSGGQPAFARRWSRRHRLFALAVAGLLAIGLAAVAITRLTAKPEVASTAVPTQTITVGTVVAGPMERTLVVTGSLVAWDELPIAAEVGDLAVTEIKVEEGDSVTRGQLLARLDDSVLRAQLAQAEAAVAQGQAAVQKTDAMAAVAASDVRRAKELSKNGYISVQTAEQRETTLAAALADANVARQTLETSKAIVAERAARLKQTEIRAPTDGIVSKRTATLGNVVPVGQQLFRMIRDSRVELRADVPEMDFPRLAVGQPVAVTLEGDAHRQFTGAIRLIGATVDPQTRIGMVYISLQADPALKPGMFVHGVVSTGSGQTLQVPEEALVYKDGKPAIFVIDANDRSRLRQVETGARRNGAVEILSGVAAGDRVALSGAGYLKDDDWVRVEAALPAIAGGSIVR